MSLHDVIQDLRSTESQAENKIQKAQRTAAENLQRATKQVEDDFTTLKTRLENDREKALKAAEQEVAKETEKITAAGNAALKKLTTSATAKKQQMKTAISKTLFP